METQTQAPRPFHILAKPIGPICNLDCSYCFYLEKEDMYPDAPNHFKMSDETLEQFVKHYIEDHPPMTKEIQFAWQGGEPTLMGIDFFKRAIELQKKYAKPGSNITNSMQTNATLLDDEWGAFLKENNFLIGVSVDGPKEIHDKFRYYKSKKGSFDMVKRGIDILIKHKVEFNTLTVVHRFNADYAKEIYDFLKEIGSTFFQFIPIVEHNYTEHGGKNVIGAHNSPGKKYELMEGVNLGERSLRPEQWGKFLNTIFDRWLECEDIGKIYVQHFDLMVGMAYGMPSSLCVHGKTCGTAVAIEHNGDLYSCDHFVQDGYKIGNLNQDDCNKAIFGEKQKKFGNDKYDTLPKECLDCNYLNYCYGACPKDRILKTSTGEDGLHYLCKGYKDFYRHTVPTFQKMAQCLKMRMPATEYKNIDSIMKRQQESYEKMQSVNRNMPCPCGSGKKHKHCCGN